LVEGEDLSERITRGPIPIDEALPIAKQIAEALEVAHEQGIIHRDLKPANIKVRSDGAVKVLDFGLAKLADMSAQTSPGPSPLSLSPTITSPAMTGVGVLLGTAAYMSPEQARGKAVDKRADIWAFGCVLYEMLTGKRAFDGEDVTDTLASVLAREPDWTALGSAPRRLRSLLQRCLQKDRRKCVGDIAAVLFVLDELQSGEEIAARTDVTVVRRAGPYIVAILAGIAAAAVVWMLRPLPPPLSRPAVRFVIDTADSGFTNAGRHLVAISPQGTHLVYSTEQRLYLRSLNQLNASPIRGTEPQPGRVVGNTANGSTAGREPFFSPDGEWIGFWQDGQLKKVSLAGGPPVTLCGTQIPWGASWAADGTILYGQGPAGIWRVSASGGEPENLVKVKPGQVALSPQMLPSGRAVIFTLADEGGNWDDAQIVVHLLNSGTLKALVKGGSDARYVASGHLVYARQDSLLAVPFDAETLTVTGGPVPLVEGVARAIQTASGIAHYSVSTDGTLVYVPGSAISATSQRTLVWVDRQGREEPIKVPPRAYVYPRLSPDGTHVAVEIREAETATNTWILDLGRLALTRLTFLPTGGRAPLWTADGRRILFNSGLAGGGNLFWQPADGSGDAERLPSTAGDFPTAATPDGAGVIISANSSNNTDVTMLPLDPRHIGVASSLDGESPRGSTAQVRPLVHTQFSERNGVVSPDGRWLSYESNASGRLEIYVRPFPQVDSGQWLVSTNGGSRPLWARDGRELFYLSEDGTLMNVPVEQASAWRAGTPRQVLQTAYFPAAALGFNYRPYDISPDGTRFLMIKQLPETEPRAGQRGIIVVTNWLDELKRLVPAK